jgi:N-acetylmuramoyl-L-alanine amidase
MNRLMAAGFAVLAVASIVLAQTSPQATVRTAAGDRSVTVILQGGHTYFPVDEVLTPLGATLTPDGTGFKVTFRNTTAVFGTDSRFGVVKEDLVEMPVVPVVVDGRPYVPWQFFQGFLRMSADSDVAWNETTHLLTISPLKRDLVTVQPSVTNVQGTSKIVLSLSSSSEYTITRDPAGYTIRFKSVLKAPFADQTFDDPYVSKLSFQESAVIVQLTSSDVVGDAYQLENPFRVVLDLRKAAALAPGALPMPAAVRPAAAPGIHTVVLDAGHGGKEVGAIGPKGLMEKDATLVLCRKLSDVLSSKLGLRVILTRNDDSLVPLDQRTAIANQYKADLFLSIHLNSAIVRGAHGPETYFLSLEASDEIARKAAEVENAQGRTTTAPAAASADLKMILWDLAQQEYLSESSRFAQALQEEMNHATGVQNRGVKQAPFKVLVGATMPAALVEVGFISNPEEEARFESEEFQNLVVASLERAVERYKSDYESRIGLAAPAAAAVPSTGTTTPSPMPATATHADVQRKPGAR